MCGGEGGRRHPGVAGDRFRVIRVGRKCLRGIQEDGRPVEGMLRCGQEGREGLAGQEGSWMSEGRSRTSRGPQPWCSFGAGRQRAWGQLLGEAGRCGMWPGGTPSWKIPRPPPSPPWCLCCTQVRESTSVRCARGTPRPDLQNFRGGGTVRVRAHS